MTKMTKTQVLELNAPSTKYEAAAYQAVIDKLTKNSRDLGYSELEKDFPGVKPQHVAHMLKQLRGDAELDVTIHSEYGVCLAKRIEREPVAA